MTTHWSVVRILLLGSLVVGCHGFLAAQQIHATTNQGGAGSLQVGAGSLQLGAATAFTLTTSLPWIPKITRGAVPGPAGCTVEVVCTGVGGRGTVVVIACGTSATTTTIATAVGVGVTGCS